MDETLDLGIFTYSLNLLGTEMLGNWEHKFWKMY